MFLKVVINKGFPLSLIIVIQVAFYPFNFWRTARRPKGDRRATEARSAEEKKGQGRKLVPRDFVPCEPHHSVTEVNKTGNSKATDRC